MSATARTVAVVTVGRSDYDILTPVLRAIGATPELRLQLIVTGTHLSPAFGETWRRIEADGFRIDARIELLAESDSPEAVAVAMGHGTIGLARTLARLRPDLLFLVGDRFEVHAAASAAVPLGIPIAHLHGGELTEGAMDDALRHSITKLSHLHFVTTKDAERRLQQMGEEPWRITVCGAPALDNLRTVPLLERTELAAQFRFPLDTPPLLVTYHPVTLERGQAEQQVAELLRALSQIERPILFTMPNADPEGRLIAERLRTFVGRTPTARMIESLGAKFHSVMAWAAAMVGNSSSGLIEAPSFGLPVVNIGTRQDGRVRGRNVIDVGNSADDILTGIRRALDPAFYASLQGMTNPYGDGHAAARIVARLCEAPMGPELLRKRFVDAPPSAQAEVAA